MPKQVKKSLVISIYFILAVSTLLVFWQVRNFDFINYDDNIYVYENPHVLNGISGDAVSWAFTTGQAANWHPLTWLSLMLDCQLFGPSPGRIHLVNVFFHIANTLLLFAVLKKMTGSLWPSAFVAAAFALHPMHVESVAWIAERKDVLSTFFWILTMWAYLRYVKKPDTVRYMLTLLIFALGLMAKPMLVTLPFLLLLLDYWPLNRLMPLRAEAVRRQLKSAPAADKNPTVYRLVIEKIPLLILASVSSTVTFLVQQKGGSVVDARTFLLYDRFANAFLSYIRYIGKLFYPRNLTVFYPFNDAQIPFWQFAACALLLFVVSVLVVYLGRNRRYLTVGWFWFLGKLVPVIGVVQVGSQAYADRYTYIPYIGLFIMIAWLLPELLAKWRYRKIVLGSSMIIVLTTLGICAHRQASYWNNGVNLFSHALEVTKNSYVAYNSLGFAYARLGRYTEAIDASKQAIKIKPNYEKAYFNLGFAYGGLGRYTEAIDACTKAIKIRPDYAEAYNNLGNAYKRLGRHQEAVEAYQHAVKIKPDYAKAHYNLGLAYLKIGDKNSALTEYNILKPLNHQFAGELLNQINK